MEELTGKKHERIYETQVTCQAEIDRLPGGGGKGHSLHNQE